MWRGCGAAACQVEAVTDWEAIVPKLRAVPIWQALHDGRRAVGRGASLSSSCCARFCKVVVLELRVQSGRLCTMVAGQLAAAHQRATIGKEAEARFPTLASISSANIYSLQTWFQSKLLHLYFYITSTYRSVW